MDALSLPVLGPADMDLPLILSDPMTVFYPAWPGEPIEAVLAIEALNAVEIDARILDVMQTAPGYAASLN